MKQYLIVIVLSLIVLSGIAWATKPDLQKDGTGQKIQACAPTLKNDIAVTGNSQTFNVTNATCWSAYVSAASKFRVMSTATKVGVQHTFPATTWRSETVSNYKYVNMSTVGATGSFRSDAP